MIINYSKFKKKFFTNFENYIQKNLNYKIKNFWNN